MGERMIMVNENGQMKMMQLLDDNDEVVVLLVVEMMKNFLNNYLTYHLSYV
jgi:hypothetical protein